MSTAIGLLAVPLVLLLLLRLGGLTPLANYALDRALRPLTPVQVRLGSLRSDGLHFLEADDVVVLAPLKGAKVPLMTIASLRLEFDAYGAWRGRIPRDEALRLARIRGMNIFVLRDAQGRWNTSVLVEGRKSPADPGPKRGLTLIPAGRVELEDSQMVFNDESKGFHSVIGRIQGSLDTRALPLVEFSLAGRTEGVARDNLLMAGEADLRDHSLDSRLDLGSVELKQYLNYFLPGHGLSFEGGRASLSVRLRAGAGELHAEGSADLEGGRLRIPGVEEPLSELNGRVAFDPQALRFKALSARFLGSVWTAEGGLDDLRHPIFNVHLRNPAFGLEALSAQVKGLAPLALSGSAQVDVGVSGPAQHPLVSGSVMAPWLSLAGVELETASAKVLMEGPKLRVENLRAQVWEGGIEGSLSMGLKKDSQLQADVVMDGVRLELARLYGQRPLPLSGTAFVELKVRGPVKDPRVDGHLELHKGFLGVLPLGKVEADLRWERSDWEASFGLLDGRVKGVVAAAGKPALFKKTVIQFKGIDLNALAAGLATAPESQLLPQSAAKAAAWLDGHLKGEADATLTLEGPLKGAIARVDFQRLKGQLTLTEGFFALADPKQPLQLEGDGSLGFGGGDIHLGVLQQPLRLRLSQKGRVWEAQALGRYPLHPDGRSGALALTLDGDLRLLDAFKFFKHSGGKLTFDGRVGGTFDAPQARGDLKVDGFATEPVAYLAPIKDGTLRAQLREQRIDVSQLSFRSGGKLDAAGSVDLSGGLKAMVVDLQVNTDQEGLRLENWDAMGTANVILDPLKLHIGGEGQPLELSGHIRLANAVIVYAGKPKSGDGAPATARAGRGLSLDLAVALGSNVWYEKQHDKQVDLLDPSKWVQSITDSAIETLARPDMYFRLKPTARDFVIQGQLPDIQLNGQIDIDRGHLTLMENDFEITQDRVKANSVSPHIAFRDKRAEVWATAVARMRYTRDDPLTKRPISKSVRVIVDIRPLDEDELEKSDLAHSFLNYNLTFDSEPPIIQGNDALQKQAILNLVVLGDPMVDLDNGAPGTAGVSDPNQGSGQLISTQINRLFTGEVRKKLASLSKGGFKFLGNGLFDVFRFVPRLKYQAANTAQPTLSSGATNAAGANQAAKDSNLAFSDVTLELGKSLTDKLYASFQWIGFGEASTSAQAVSAAQTSRITRNYGMRTGMEYQLTPNRTLEGFYNYSVDDNLEPVAFDPDKIYQAHSGVVRLRNTIPTDTYSQALSRERRWGMEESR